MNFDEDFKLQFEEDINEEERKFYLKLFPSLNLVREKKTHCTTCNIHLGTAPANEHNIYMHPLLKATQCKKCNEFYKSGDFRKGDDGSEMYCRWCGQGGEVYCCAKCSYVFCKSCISINLAKSLVTDIRDNENWVCFICSPKITWPIRATHWALQNYIQKQKKLILSSSVSEEEKTRIMQKDTSLCCEKNLSKTESVCLIETDLLKSSDSLSPKRRKKSVSIDTSIVKPIAKKQLIHLSPRTSTVFNCVSSRKQNGLITKNNSINLVQINNKNIRPVVKNTNLHLNRKYINPVEKVSSCNDISTNTHQIPSNQSAVKIVQLKHQNRLPRMEMQFINSKSTPPPLVIRNRNVQIRPLVSSSIIAQSRTIAPTVQVEVQQKTDQTPVFHNIGGFCIDLNSAAQHDSIRLPNGKIIQVKKSTTTSPNNNSNSLQQLPSSYGTQNQSQHHFTITQPMPLSNTVPSLAAPSINQTPAPSIIQTPAQQQQILQTVPILPNGTSQVQVINSNLVQKFSGNASTQSRPTIIKNIFPTTPIGKARGQLQNQIFSSMEIYQHLNNKLQTLTNSNPYKNANTFTDINDLYIHLSYLITYGIGRLKNIQDKISENMSNLGFKVDISVLKNGQTSREKCLSDDEIEIVQPKITTINLDSENEDDDLMNGLISQNSKQCEKPKQNEELKNIVLTKINPNKKIARKQMQSLQRKTFKPEYRPIAPKNTEADNIKLNTQTIFKQYEIQKNTVENPQINSSSPNLEFNNYIGVESEYDTMSLLAGMLEVEITEDKVPKQVVKKRPKKKPTTKINQNTKLSLNAKRNQKIKKLKKSDLKLKQKCFVKLVSLDINSAYFKEALLSYNAKRISELIIEPSNTTTKLLSNENKIEIVNTNHLVEDSQSKKLFENFETKQKSESILKINEIKESNMLSNLSENVVETDQLSENDEPTKEKKNTEINCEIPVNKEIIENEKQTLIDDLKNDYNQIHLSEEDKLKIISRDEAVIIYDSSQHQNNNLKVCENSKQFHDLNMEFLSSLEEKEIDLLSNENRSVSKDKIEEDPLKDVSEIFQDSNS